MGDFEVKSVLRGQGDQREDFSGVSINNDVENDLETTNAGLLMLVSVIIVAWPVRKVLSALRERVSLALPLLGLRGVQLLLHHADTALRDSNAISAEQAGHHSSTKGGERVVLPLQIIQLGKQLPVRHTRGELVIPDKPAYRFPRNRLVQVPLEATGSDQMARRG